MEADFGSGLDGLRHTLEALGGHLGGVLTAMLSEDLPRRHRKASKLNNMMKTSIFGLLEDVSWEHLGGSWGCLGGS